MTSSFILNCDSELTAIKLDLCDDSKSELETESGYLNLDNLKQETLDSDVVEISVSNVSGETKSSPLSKSRYGRIHKPKFDEDFLSTDKKVGAILGIMCTPQKSSGPSSKTSTPKKLWQSPNGSASDVMTDPDTSAENISRTYRDICEIFSPQTENFRGFGSNKSGEIPSSLNDMPECSWMPGDLAWARVGSHPYWPCIVTVDPMVQTFKKINLREKDHKQKWTNLRNSYARNLRNQKKPSGSGSDHKHKWYLADVMSFLDYMQHHKQKGNFENKVGEEKIIRLAPEDTQAILSESIDVIQERTQKCPASSDFERLARSQKPSPSQQVVGPMIDRVSQKQ